MLTIFGAKMTSHKSTLIMKPRPGVSQAAHWGEFYQRIGHRGSTASWR
jgi:hypothetical protein